MEKNFKKNTDTHTYVCVCPWDSPGKNTGVGSHSLLQGIFLTNPGLQHCRHILYHLSHQGSPVWSCVYIQPPGGASGKELVCQQETQELPVWPLGWEDPLEEERATHSRIRAWRIPWTEEPGRLQSIGLQKVGHDWSKLACIQACIYVYVYIYISKSLCCRAET